MFIAANATNVTLSGIPVYMTSSPLIFFPPKLAYQISVAIYIHIGCLAVFLWDVINNLGEDYRLLTRYKINLPTVIYFITRITLLAYMMCRAILLTLPVANCAEMYDGLNALLVVFVSATMAMFYLRVCAVYRMNRFIVVAYGILWLAVVAMLVTLTQTFTAVHIGNTQNCGEMMHGPFLGPTTVVLMVNDTLVYIALAYKIFSMFSVANTTHETRLATLLTFGKSLPIVSRALFKDSQLYFVVVIVTNPIIVACVYAFDAPLDVMLLVCHLVVVNILSCRVYRNIRMGLVPDIATPPSISGREYGTDASLRRAEEVSDSSERTAARPTICGRQCRTSYSNESSIYAITDTKLKSSFVEVEKGQAY